MFPWKDSPELKARIINRAHLPEASPAGVSPDVLFVDRARAERFHQAGRAFHRSASQVTRHHPVPILTHTNGLSGLSIGRARLHGAQNFAGKGNRSLNRVSGIIR